MKYILLLLFSFHLFASNIDSYAEKMQFQRDYNTAINLAKKEQKMLVMVSSADYCPWCRKFERKTLSSSLIEPILTQDVVTLLVDNKYDIGEFPEKFNTKYTPMVFFIDPKNSSILKRTTGYVKKRDFLEYINEAKKLFKAQK